VQVVLVQLFASAPRCSRWQEEPVLLQHLFHLDQQRDMSWCSL
jgi:hypothetical protein